jgi:hypothetical protein
MKHERMFHGVLSRNKTPDTTMDIGGPVSMGLLDVMCRAHPDRNQVEVSSLSLSVSLSQVKYGLKW